MTSTTPASFGRYEIIRKLGRSMTDVYLALDPDADRRVVLKIVEQCDDAMTQIVVEAERRGALIQQQLHTLDQRILEVYEYGDQNGCFFVAMQYAEGTSLAEMLQERNRLDPMQAARYAEEVASQLTTLHAFQADMDGRRQAIVHGDIKPSNIQIGPRGEVWLLDFGIAKVITATRNLTQHNLGSPAYCSPERLRRGHVDPHADLWALGVSLYEMIAGLPPYHAQSTRKLENLIQSRKPPRALPDHCPDALRAIIRKALAADLEKRYLTAIAFREDLRAFLERRPTVAEGEGVPAWDANATLQKTPPDRPAAQTLPVRSGFTGALPHIRGLALSLAAGIIVGLLCFIPGLALYRFWHESAPLRIRRDYIQAKSSEIDADVQRFRKIQQRGGIAAALSLTEPVGRQLRSSLVSTGDDVLDGYRISSSGDLAAFDWAKAKQCYSRALELHSDADTQGKLALVEGYLALARTPAEMRPAEASFREAGKLLAKGPDPHLGMARVFIYGHHNMGQALAEFHAAERLGFKLGPREHEQEADGFLFRAEQQLKSAAASKNPVVRRHMAVAAQRDFDRAKALYEPLAGYSNVNARLDRLYAAESTAEVLMRPPKPAPRHTKKTVRFSRRWR